MHEASTTPIVAMSAAGTPTTTSRQVAQMFNKKHKNVLQAIRDLLPHCPEEFTELNFQPSEYTDSTGRTLPSYTITRDGFSLLAMGFTGPEATTWKIRYIEAFNAMERTIEAIKQKAAAEALKPVAEVMLSLQQSVSQLAERVEAVEQGRSALPAPIVQPMPHICELVRRFIVERGYSRNVREAKEHGQVFLLSNGFVCINSTMLSEWLNASGYIFVTPTRVGKLLRQAGGHKTSYPFREGGKYLTGSYHGYSLPLELCGLN